MPKANPMVRAATSTSSEEWRTPPQVIEAARSALGHIDLDPATTEEANAAVKAHLIYDKRGNGLSLPWYGNVWCNPPYGKTGSKSTQGLWLDKAIAEVEEGNANAVVMLLAAHVGRKWFREVWRHTACFFDERLKFIGEDGKPGDAPTHGNVAIMISRNVTMHRMFAIEFDRHGRIIEPTYHGAHKWGES